MRVIIAGTRTITDRSAVVAALIAAGFEVSEVVCGGAPGVDALGAEIAFSYGVPVKYFPADWAKHGRAAGPLRNEEMAIYASALVAVWDGKSRGTADMIRRAKAHGLKVYVHMVKSSPQDRRAAAARTCRT